MKIRTLTLAVLPEDKPIFDECCTIVTIDDEAAGEYVIVKQEPLGKDEQSIGIDPDEWPAIRDAIDSMFSEIKMHTQETE